jgi:anti-sigma regulatory factor (Ser/Thr protein kinase)
MARVKVRITKSLEQVYKVRNGMTIGRDPKNTIQVLAQPVSRNHAQFVVVGDTVNIVDLGSSNGTKVNGERVSEAALQDGDVIDIGGIAITYEKEVAHVADENIFALETPDIPEDRINEIADRNEVGLVLASDSDMVDLAYNISRKYLERIGLPDDDNVNVLTALYEAMDNAKRHGNKSDPSKKIYLYFMDLKDVVALSVVDEGSGFDYASVLQMTEEKDALTAARERYMAGGMGGLGIRLMLKCVDKIEYEREGSKIVLSKFKEPLQPEEVEEKKLTAEEQIYKTTLWDEIEKAEERLPERIGKLAEREGQAELEPPPDIAAIDEGTSATRPEDRIKRFEERLSQFFIRDGGEGLKAVSPQDVVREEETPENEEKAEPESGNDLQINMPDHIRADDSPPDDDNLDLEL